MSLNQLELNVIESFRLVKTDIVKLQNLVAVLSENQEKLVHQLAETREKEISLYHGLKDLKQRNNNQKIVQKTVKVRVASHKRKVYFASKNSTKFHAANCIFAKNIKPKSKLTFKSKNKALNLGFKACDCIKKI